MSSHAHAPRAGRRGALDPPASGSSSRSSPSAASWPSGASPPASAAVSNLNDGYPWGIWIAFDVVTGTALGCGGYAVALLVYILNKGEYHPLVRPAILTSVLGYALAVARRHDRPRAALGPLEGPDLLLALEPLPAARGRALRRDLRRSCSGSSSRPPFFEKWQASRDSGLPALRREGAPRLVSKALLWIIALGILLPTMHQSSLGTLMLLTGPKLHPLWHTPLLPFLFLVYCVLMGFGVVVFESHGCGLRPSAGRGRPTMLGRLSQGRDVASPGSSCSFRVVDLALRRPATCGPSPSSTARCSSSRWRSSSRRRHPAALARPSPRPGPAGLWRPLLMLVRRHALPLQHLPRRLPAGRSTGPTSRPSRRS